MRRFILALFIASGSLTTVASADSVPLAGSNGWSEQTTAAAAGYCLARHPYIAAPQTGDPYTLEGFEIPGSPGIVGAVRRNFVYRRSPPPALPRLDVGNSQTCQQACGQFGKLYGPGWGTALHYRSPSGSIVADGVGDMASLVMQDYDFYHLGSVDEFLNRGGPFYGIPKSVFAL